MYASAAGSPSHWCVGGGESTRGLAQSSLCSSDPLRAEPGARLHVEVLSKGGPDQTTGMWLGDCPGGPYPRGPVLENLVLVALS